MIQSRPIDIDGRVVGVAVNASSDWHFVSADPRLDDIHGSRFANPDEMTRVARLVLQRSSGERLRAPRLPA